MDKNIQELIQGQWTKLPRGLRDVVLDLQFKTKIEATAQKYSLNQDQTESLLLETLLVMVGLEYSKNYLRNIQKDLKLSDQMTRVIGAEISATMFKPAGEDLKELNDKMESAQTDESATRMDGLVITPQEETSTPVKINRPLNREIATSNAESRAPSSGFVAGTMRVSSTIDQGVIPIKNIIDDKLNNIVKLPKEEKFVDALAQQKGYKEIDPYREPIE